MHTLYSAMDKRTNGLSRSLPLPPTRWPRARSFMLLSLIVDSDFRWSSARRSSVPNPPANSWLRTAYQARFAYPPKTPMMCTAQRTHKHQPKVWTYYIMAIERLGHVDDRTIQWWYSRCVRLCVHLLVRSRLPTANVQRTHIIDRHLKST